MLHIMLGIFLKYTPCTFAGCKVINKHSKKLNIMNNAVYIL